MNIISARYVNTGDSIPKEQIRKDRPILERQHAAACKNEPTWSMFGGVLHIEDRSYQVC